MLSSVCALPGLALVQLLITNISKLMSDEPVYVLPQASGTSPLINVQRVSRGLLLKNNV